MRTVVFDLDGTLADTSADLITAANACFAALGYGTPLNPQDDALTAFHGGRAMLRLGFARLGLGEDGVDAQYHHLLAHYRDGICRETRMYPGAVDAVRALRHAGFICSICTNKPEGLAETLLKQLGVRDLFGALVGADTLPVRKPDPAPYRLSVTAAGGDPRQSMLVGDTDTDRQTARAAGVPVALVTFGPEGHGVARFQPEALLHRFEELPDIAERMLR